MPSHIGVCTDLVVRAYRAVGVDLQVRVHEDMTAAFASYPRAWGFSRPDSNIDHAGCRISRRTSGAAARSNR